MDDHERERLGQSGVFQRVVAGARKFKRAVTGGEPEPNTEARELGETIAQAFIAGRFADIHALATPALQERTEREQFVVGWRDAIADRGPFTGFDISDIGAIDLAFIPGLEEVPQSQLVAFLELTFSSPSTLDDANAFVVGAVLLDDGGAVRIGALHAR